MITSTRISDKTQQILGLIYYQNKFSEALSLTQKNINDLDEHTPFPFHEAFLIFSETLNDYGQRNILKMFKILKPFLDVNKTYKDDHLGGSSLLHYLIYGSQNSSFNDFKEKIKILSKIGFELEKQDYPYLLNSSIGCNNLPATRWILESGKDIETPSSKWNTPFRQLFEEAHKDDVEWMEILRNYESSQLQEKLQNTLQKTAFLKTKIKL